MFDLLKTALEQITYPEPPDVYTLGRPLPFFELFQCRIPEEPGVGAFTLNHDTRTLHAYALFRDSDIFSATTGDNQHSWELGDTFELFFRLPNHSDYYEIHSTPNNHRLQLHFDDCRTRQEKPLETHFCDLKTSVYNVVDSQNHLWYSQILIPLDALETDQLDGMAFALQRFNRSRQTPGKYEVSSSRKYPETHTGHTPFAWHVISHANL